MNDRDATTMGATIKLLESLMRGAHVADIRADDALATVGLTATKWFALRRLVEAGGSMSLGDAALCLACARSNVTQLIDRLERDGLVRRVPDPIDRRSILAQITDAGRQRYQAGWRAMGKLESSLTDALTPAERDLLLRALSKLVRVEEHVSE
jgi:DNA-binding MarR family transcriptional regulator